MHGGQLIQVIRLGVKRLDQERLNATGRKSEVWNDSENEKDTAHNAENSQPSFHLTGSPTSYRISITSDPWLCVLTLAELTFWMLYLFLFSKDRRSAIRPSTTTCLVEERSGMLKGRVMCVIVADERLVRPDYG